MGDKGHPDARVPTVFRHDGKDYVSMDEYTRLGRVYRDYYERRWTPVSDRLPQEGEPVIVWLPDIPHHPCGMDIGSYMTGSWGVSWMVSGGRSAFPSHWMPLPSPPEANT